MAKLGGTAFDIDYFRKEAKSSQEVSLTDVIGPAFYDTHWDIVKGNHTYYNLAGGRGSLKSSFIASEIVLGITEDPQANAVVFRKVGDTIADSVYEQIVWAIDKLEMSDLWHCTTSPFRCIYIPTGQRIIFKGLDKAKKSKSAKVSKGYFKYLWFEELDEFAGPEEIRTVQQSIIRGGKKFFIFKSFNPPRSNSNWANTAFAEEEARKDVYSSRTTYLQAPPEWLGQQFIDDAEWLKQINPKAYEHEYLGIPVGTGSQVFDNIVGKALTDEEIADFPYRYMGIDWGWYPDPFQWMCMYYDGNRRILYIYDEYRANKTPNEETWRYLHEVKHVNTTDIITADSAEQKSIADYRAYGANCRGAEKGPNSVRYGIKWLQSLSKIVIDPTRCPNAWNEFTKYEYERTKEGEILSSYPDMDNHCLTGDTVVSTILGDFPIKDLVGITGKLHCVSADGHIVTGEFFDVRKTQENAEIYEVEFENGDTIRGTAEHPVLTLSKGWVNLSELTNEDNVVRLLARNKLSKERVKQVRELGITEDVYNMEVKRYHNFGVNGGYIVHNCIDATRYAMERIFRRRGQ